jgi:hypothetical protein
VPGNAYDGWGTISGRRGVEVPLAARDEPDIGGLPDAQDQGINRVASVNCAGPGGELGAGLLNRVRGKLRAVVGYEHQAGARSHCFGAGVI